MTASSPDPIAFSRPWFDEREEAAVRKALGGHVSGDGPIGRRVEARLAAQLGATRVLLTTSGTHALELALLALGVGPGQEVICPSFTFVSSANAVLRVGARPVFADIEDQTLGLDPADVEPRVTPRTVALLPVHYAGVAPDMGALLDLARRRGLRVVEDAAQGLAATWRGRALGTLGDAGCLSFHETKNVTCGEGGRSWSATPSSRAGPRSPARRARTGPPSSAARWTSTPGWRRAPATCCPTSSPPSSTPSSTSSPRSSGDGPRSWRATARGSPPGRRRRGVRLPPELPERGPNHHVFFLLYPDARRRDAALRSLRAQGVMATFHYVPLHSAPHARRLGVDVELPVTDRVAATLLRLPLHPLLSAGEVDRVIAAVRETGSGG